MIKNLIKMIIEFFEYIRGEKKKEYMPFDLNRYTYSMTASRKGIDNRPGKRELRNMQYVHEKVIVPIAKHFGKKKIKINSFYRCPELNKAVGSRTQNSQHIKGEAVDIEIWGMTNSSLFFWLKNNIDYDQLILECYSVSKGPMSGWCHVSYVRPSDFNRRESFCLDNEGRVSNFEKRRFKNPNIV